MKLKTALPFIFAILLFSCIDLGSFDDDAYVGIGIDIGNLTDKEFNILKLHIGGIEDSTFISTDVFELPTIIIRPNDRFSQVITFGETRWQTDLEKISKVSNEAYFALEFEDGQVVKVKESFKEDFLLNFSVIGHGNVIKDEYGGRLFLSVEDNKNANGSFFEDTFFR